MDDKDIEYWITVNGNHIPVKQGQSKSQAVDEFLKEKDDARGYSVSELKERQAQELDKFNDKQRDGSIKRYSSMSKVEREKSIKNHKKRLDLHIDKIKNPEKYIQNWAGLSKQRRSGILAYWGKEVVNFQKQISILEKMKNE